MNKVYFALAFILVAVEGGHLQLTPFVTLALCACAFAVGYRARWAPSLARSTAAFDDPHQPQLLTLRDVATGHGSPPPHSQSGITLQVRLDQRLSRGTGALQHTLAVDGSLRRLIRMVVHEVAGTHTLATQHARAPSAAAHNENGNAVSVGLRSLLRLVVDASTDLGGAVAMPRGPLSMHDFVEVLAHRSWSFGLDDTKQGAFVIERAKLVTPTRHGHDATWHVDVNWRLRTPVGKAYWDPTSERMRLPDGSGELRFGKYPSEALVCRITFGEAHKAVSADVTSVAGSVSLPSPTIHFGAERVEAHLDRDGALFARVTNGFARWGVRVDVDATATVPIYMRKGKIVSDATVTPTVKNPGGFLDLGQVVGNALATAFVAVLGAFGNSTEQFTSGEVAKLLKKAFNKVQKKGVDKGFKKLREVAKKLGLGITLDKLAKSACVAVNGADGVEMPQVLDGDGEPWVRVSASVEQTAVDGW